MRKWIAADRSHQVYFDQLKQVWEKSREAAAVSIVNEDEAWNRFRARIQVGTAAPASVHRMRPHWLQVAAAVIILTLLGVAGYWMFNGPQPAREMVVQATQQVVNDTLPDGSIVTLNKRSSVTYPAKFLSDQRNISLQGEAFFRVTPNERKPFVVSINDVSITVLGTAFNVKSVNGTTEVIVESGRVRVTRGDKTVELGANERIITGEAENTLQKETSKDRLYNYYRTREFVCDDTPLWKLVQVLNEAYGANIVIGNPAIRDMKLNASFYNESLDQVLEVISLTFNISVTRTANQVVLQ